MRSCFEFVKVGYAFVEIVNNLNSQIFVKVELHELLARVKDQHVGIRTWEDWHFLMWKKSKHARSGIRTHASTRRPEYPNSSTIAIALSTDDLKSGAFDHSAILAPIKLLLFRK